ncbi:MAG: tRNA pseudouridine(13) synthase TruD [Gammaproteobacteria bacterium]
MPCAHGKDVCVGDYRVNPEDFFVSESGAEPLGEGEHLYLRIRKTGQNTRWVAKEIARQLRIPFRAVSYAGLKDRHAVTEQWFGVQLIGQPDPEPGVIDIEGVEILKSVRHRKKLRQGELSYNLFRIILRECRYSDAGLLEKRLQQVALEGVPAYFGPQRFGKNLANLDLPAEISNLEKLPREQRSFVISALRSALFNGYLAERVSRDNWAEVLPGENTISDRPRGIAESDQSVFTAERLPAGMLWGAGAVFAANQAGDQERDYFAQFPAVCALLEAAGARVSRRILKTRVANMSWQLQDNVMQLEFVLGPGQYATAVLQEIGEFHDQGDGDA